MALLPSVKPPRGGSGCAETHSELTRLPLYVISKGNQNFIPSGLRDGNFKNTCPLSDYGRIGEQQQSTLKMNRRTNNEGDIQGLCEP